MYAQTLYKSPQVAPGGSGVITEPSVEALREDPINGAFYYAALLNVAAKDSSNGIFLRGRFY